MKGVWTTAAPGNSQFLDRALTRQVGVSVISRSHGDSPLDGFPF